MAEAWAGASDGCCDWVAGFGEYSLAAIYRNVVSSRGWEGNQCRLGDMQWPENKFKESEPVCSCRP